MYQDGTSKILNEQLIQLGKEESGMFWNQINYRDFIGEISDSNKVIDDHLAKLNIDTYWAIENEALIEEEIIDSNRIVILFWTKEFGLTEYIKKNGDTLRLNVP